jgi:hypothetical protein
VIGPRPGGTAGPPPSPPGAGTGPDGLEPGWLSNVPPEFLDQIRRLLGGGPTGPMPQGPLPPATTPPATPPATTPPATPPARSRDPISYEQWRTQTSMRGAADFRNRHGDSEQSYQRWLGRQRGAENERRNPSSKPSPSEPVRTLPSPRKKRKPSDDTNVRY